MDTYICQGLEALDCQGKVHISAHWGKLWKTMWLSDTTICGVIRNSKYGVLEHKSGNISETRIDRGKVTMGAYSNSPMLFPTAPSPTPYTASPSPRLGFATHPKLISIISGTGKAMNFKFGQNNNRVHPNKSPWKILEKRKHGHIQGVHKFFWYPLLSQEREKLRISNLAGIFRGSIRTKSH